jgi:hypothetical protein
VKRYLIIVFLAIQSCFLTAQTASIETLEVCAAQEVLIPVMASSISNVGALTLYVGFDTINLSYISVENIDPQIEGLTVNLMSNPTQIAFAWSNTSPVNFSNNKLFDLKFYSNGINGQVIFNNGCEISDTGGVVVPVTYIDGSVNSGLPVIISDPSDTTVLEGSNAGFHIAADNTMFFSWRESQDNGTSWITLDDNDFYSGTKTAHLTVINTPLNFNGYLYQCVLSTNVCQITSEDALLSVDELTSSEVIVNTEKNRISLAPVPCYDYLLVDVDFPDCKTGLLKVINVAGKIVKSIPFRPCEVGIQHITLTTDDLSAGNYTLVVIAENGYVAGKSFIKSEKLNK